RPFGAPLVGRADPFLASPGRAPILVVGTKRDAVRWASGSAGQLRSGVQFSYEGDGHTAYAGGSPCVDDMVDRCLVEGIAERWHDLSGHSMIGRSKNPSISCRLLQAVRHAALAQSARALHS